MQVLCEATQCEDPEVSYQYMHQAMAYMCHCESLCVCVHSTEHEIRSKSARTHVSTRQRF